MNDFTEDDIKRTGLPKDVMGLIHDLCYHVNNNLRGTLDDKAVENYVLRAQEILKREIPIGHTKQERNIACLLGAIEDMKRYVTNDKHIPWNNVVHYADKLKSHSRT